VYSKKVKNLHWGERLLSQIPEVFDETMFTTECPKLFGCSFHTKLINNLHFWSKWGFAAR